MSKTLNTQMNADGTFSYIPELNPAIQNGQAIISATQALVNDVYTSNNMLNYALQNHASTIRKYWNTESDWQLIRHNEVDKYNSLLCSQNNLLNRINIPVIKLWRYKDNFYYRTSSGQLLNKKQIEMQQELSSRYGSNIIIVPSLNEVLQNKEGNQFRINTIFLAINAIHVIEEEIFNPYTKYELFQDQNGVWKRNLLAYTRYSSNGKHISSPNDSFTKKLLSEISENSSKTISTWISNMGIADDSILLLIGNQTLSKDLVFEKVIAQLFNTGIATTLTDEMLQKKSLAEIAKGVFFLHIDHIPKDEHDREKLRNLLTSLIIPRSILSNGYTIPTQTKVIVTIDEADPFFKDFIEITTTLFIKSEKDLLNEYNISSKISLYPQIENTLDVYAVELLFMPIKSHKELQNDNQRYLELLSQTTPRTFNSTNDLPVLDPCTDSFDTFMPKGDFHTLITGQTRIGKSFLMLTLMIRYILRDDCSIILFDIHSDLAKKVIRLIKDPTRLLYISPTLSNSHSLTTNLFETTDKSEKNIAKLSQIILRVLKSIKMDESFSGPMEEMLINCIRVLLRKGGGSFAELYRFMNNERNKDLVEYAKHSTNPLEEEYFNDYFQSATNTKDAVRRRLSSLLSDPLFSNLMNGINTVDLEKEMNTPGKIIIFDIPKGEMENTYEYYIKFILEYIQILALKRVELPKEQRTLTHLFIDEAHNFITPNGNIETILTEAGKYNLYLTMANPTISQYRTSDFRDILLSMTDAKIIGKNSNQTLDAMNKTLRTKLENVENLSKGQFYISVANNNIVKVQNTDRFIDDKEHISDEQWEEHKQYQLNHYYRSITPKTIFQPTEEELVTMIQQFRTDLISKNLTESSCLYKLRILAPERLEEIENDFEYVTTKSQEYKPRVRQQELSTVFQLAFELDSLIENSKFIDKLKGAGDMFEQTSSGTRLAKFTSDGASKTEQYYYF